MDRNEWRLVVHVHLAESKKEAMDQARKNAGRYQRECFEETLGQSAAFDGTPDKIIDAMVESNA